jgi:hypothetical protein
MQSRNVNHSTTIFGTYLCRKNLGKKPMSGKHNVKLKLKLPHSLDAMEALEGEEI